ncbi:unnamed protein product [Acanthoscelides obtectus]|nr:unnamed protein product [Acanthoscelides obtectus]CAK1687861.1 hypothetical protein AOBTE_LOCUS36415 [Acanthoscelides obtectus]
MVQSRFSLLVLLTFLCIARSQDFTAQLLKPGHECVRECKEGESPMFCHYKFTVELYQTLGAPCDLCHPDDKFTSKCPCILADGFERTLLAVNKMLPAPSIQVCAGDRIVVDVTNAMEGYDTTLHWHGLRQKNTQYFDGVPMITQCPISAGQTFRYQMITNEGTYFYHTHSGLQKFDGIEGSVIARLPRSQDGAAHLFDYDLPEHVVFVNDWMHTHIESKFPGLRTRSTAQQPTSILINGKGRWTDLSAGNTTTTPLEVFNVKKGYRYRFRMINSMTSACTLGMRVIGHNLTVITTDGELVRPQVVDAIHSSAGERYDFILHADQEAGEYWIQFWATGLCLDDQIQQLAILKYEGSDSTKLAVVPTYQEALNHTGLALNYPLTTCGHDTTHGLCLAHLRSGYEIDDKELLKEKPDVKLYLNYTLMSYAAEELFQNDSHRTYAVFGGTQYVQAFVNGYSFKFPPSPLLSQYQDAKHSICPTDGSNPPGCSGNCSCTNVFNVPLNSVVEIVMIDGVDLADVHSFHLHGYTFKVVGMGTPADLNVTACNSNNIREFDEAGKLKR